MWVYKFIHINLPLDPHSTGVTAKKKKESLHNVMQINKNVISCPVIHSNVMDKTNNSGRRVRFW